MHDEDKYMAAHRKLQRRNATLNNDNKRLRAELAELKAKLPTTADGVVLTLGMTVYLVEVSQGATLGVILVAIRSGESLVRRPVEDDYSHTNDWVRATRLFSTREAAESAMKKEQQQ